MGNQFDAVFEKGVFRPLQPVDLPEHQRVTFFLPGLKEIANGSALAPEANPCVENRIPDGEDEIDAEMPYEPLPMRECKTIRVKYKFVGEIPLLPYPVEDTELEADDRRE